MTEIKEIIETNIDLCNGCNRCVRECPMEMANITYQDEAGIIKVKIDHDKCINCGRCFTSCHRDARYYIDDTERFFEDLSNGIPISLIAAPSIRTNIPDWKRLFTWLKDRGVNKIYDVSLGADICIWAHVRYIEKNNYAPLITQPCPVIVNYCEKYRHDLLKNLSPVQSPMGCIAVYMKEYEGITDKIAALSPCVAKAKEFEETGLSQYNVTFARLLEYLKRHNIKLPEKETGFDHYESGLGAVFPMPGGLQENIEFFMGKELSIDKAEGYNVFERLNTYAESPEELLPAVFDVLNCGDGCNIGTAACLQSRNFFQINRLMDKSRKTALDNREREYFCDLHKKYDDTFDLSRYMRVYKPHFMPFPVITDEDIEHAFKLLNKNDKEKQTIDCGACGSDTCRGMARKIALGVNIPINCVINSMETAKAEHLENLATREQVEAMAEMREADERMRIMLDSTPIGAQYWDKDFKITDCNKETLRLFNLSSKQEYIERFYDLSPEYQPDGRLSKDVCVEYIKKAFEEGYLRVEWMQQSLDGEPIPVEVTLVRVDYKGKNIVAAYVRDLREQKRMMKEIDANAARLKAVVSNYPGIIWNMDRDNTITLFNGLYLKEIGVEHSFIEGKNIGAALQKNRHLDFVENSQKTFKEGPQDWISEIDGKMYRARTAPIYSGNGDITGLVGSIDDLTETIKLQEKLKASLKKNELQLAKIKMAVQATKIGLWEVEIATRNPVSPETIFIWSDEFRHMLGYRDETDFPNCFQSWLDRVHPDDGDRVLSGFTEYLSNKHVPTFEHEYWLMKKNGEYAYFRGTGEIIRDEAGNPLRVAGTIMDITETKNILLDTERQRVEAEAANKAKSAFLSTMSHEIRTPMNAILGITEIQLQNTALDKSVKEAFNKIYVSGDMLLGIINDILDLSKIEAGKLELATAKYEIASMISDTAQLNMMRIGSKPIEFELCVDENLPMHAIGDELRVKQILNNVLSNAIKYTDNGTVGLSIAVENSGNKNDGTVMMVFVVSDTGQGMTKEQVDRLFDEYARFNTEANRTTEGTGLGMSITQNLVRMMNGTINIESEPGKGSTLIIRLPQGKSGSEILGSEMVENLHKFRTSSRSQMKRVQIAREHMPYGSVLIVDDVETNIYVAMGLLVPYGLNIDSADSGFSAIEKIKNGNVYDIVFMDHMMPKMDGVEATNILREMGYKHPIVALTANAVSGQSDMFFKNSFDDYISKPIDVRQLNTVLNRLIRDKQPPEVIDAARRKTEVKNALSAPQPVIDPNFAEAFVRDAAKSIAALEAIDQKRGVYDDADIRRYVIHAHGMKSALATIGKTELSAVAAKLEQSGRNGNTEVMALETPAFISSLREAARELTPKEENKSGETSDEDRPFLLEKLLVIKAACEEYDEQIADGALAELRKKAWPPPARELLNTIAGHLLHSDFDEIVNAINQFTKA